MEKKIGGKVFILIIGILIIISSIYFIFADPIGLYSDGTTSKTFNEDTVYVVNVSVNNTDTLLPANISMVNITFPVSFRFINNTNVTSSTTAVINFSNTTNRLSWNADNLTANLTKIYFAFNLTQNTSGTYTINITANNNTGQYNTTLTYVVNDTTNITYNSQTTASGNLSQNFTYANVSVTETNEDITIFELHNSTGLYNRTVGNGVRLFNWTGLAQGTYKFNVTVNDSAGNSNKTVDRTVTLDTTNPVASASCSKATYSQGEAISCTCGGTDNIDTSLTNTGSSYSTSNAGSFSFSCTATDDAGNANTATFAYKVEGSSGDLPGGGGSVNTVKTTYVVNDADLSAGYTHDIKANERFTVSVNKITHHVTVTQVTGSGVTIEVASTPQTANMQSGDERKFDVNNDGTYDLNVKLNSVTNNVASVTVKAISEKVTAEAKAAEAQKENTAAQAVNNPTTPTTSSNKTMWIIVGIIVVLAIIGIVYYVRKKK